MFQIEIGGNLTFAILGVVFLICVTIGRRG